MNWMSFGLLEFSVPLLAGCRDLPLLRTPPNRLRNGVTTTVATVVGLRRRARTNPYGIRPCATVAPWCYSCIRYAFLESDMSTTTIRLPDELKARVAVAAKHAGTTAHAFILEAIAEKAEQAERRADFDAVAEARYAQHAATGKTIPWQDMRAYLEARIDGKAVKRPVGRKLAD